MRNMITYKTLLIKAILKRRFSLDNLEISTENISWANLSFFSSFHIHYHEEYESIYFCRRAVPSLIFCRIFNQQAGNDQKTYYISFEMEGVPPASASKGCTRPFLLDYSTKPYKSSTKINPKRSRQTNDNSLHLQH